MARIETIGLTSPYTRGPEVEHAQKQLQHNRFGKFYDGKIDGIFGPHTAGACKEAHRALGFPTKDVRARYDYALDARLTGGRKLGPAFSLRRKKRKRDAQKSGDIKRRAVQIGLKEVGTKESPPDSNHVKYSEWYGLIGPWCLEFQTWIFVKAGSKVFQQGHRWAYNPTLEAAAAHGDLGLRFTNDPEEGDLVQYHFPGAPAGPHHVGTFLRWIKKGSTFKALEGNTAVGNESNGGEVMIRERDMTYVTHFIRYPS